MTALGLWGRDSEDLLGEQGPRRQPLRGFDDDYADIVDYIIRCTHRIWEGKDLGLIATHYSDDCLIHTMAGDFIGMAGVIAGTTRTLSAFPDRVLVGEAVIWSGNEDDGYLSSHRNTSHGTNVGTSEFGPATNARAQWTTIADCLCRENLIVEEWLVRDNSAIARQLGVDARALGSAQAFVDRMTSPAEWRAREIERVRSTPTTGFPSLATPDNPVTFSHWLFDTVWNHRRLNAVHSAYAPNVHATMPNETRLFGHGEVTGYLIALLACFSDTRVCVDHVAVVQEGPFTDVAVRWTLAGTHDGGSLYGSPSLRPVYMLAVSHWRMQGGCIVEEVTIWDEVALWRQVEGGL